ncbi:unnamed protein product [Polarella glacialis]|uniref:Uncharacterized protein n=1 Tax=Polarella glacialis TaxID=89957 RepID=A0A813GPF6_POLGL|nr:unnamed protein product [Polarella glacialis]
MFAKRDAEGAYTSPVSEAVLSSGALSVQILGATGRYCWLCTFACKGDCALNLPMRVNHIPAQWSAKPGEKVAWLWLRNMRRYAPDIYERAIAMNKRDKFKMRHQRPAGDRLPDASSSSSESSSDSTSDGEADLDPAGLQDAVAPGMKLGVDGLRHQGPHPVTGLVTSSRCSTIPGPRGRADASQRKRRRMDAEALQSLTD